MQEPRSQGIHADDLRTRSGKTAGSNPTSPARPPRRSSGGRQPPPLARSWRWRRAPSVPTPSTPLTVRVGCWSRSGGLAAAKGDGLERGDDDDARSAADGLAVAQHVVVVAGDEGVVTGHAVG